MRSTGTMRMGLALFIDQGFSYFDVEFTAHDKETYEISWSTTSA